MSDGSIPVFLAGEGRNELGSWWGEKPYQGEGEDGVMVALLRKVRPSGWHVVGARTWRPDARRSRRSRGRSNFVAPTRFNVGGREPPARFEHGDTRIVIEAANDALDANCRVVALLRDADNDSERTNAMKQGVEWVERELGPGLAVVGGVAIPKLEGWILACAGVRRTEELSGPKAEELLRVRQVAAKDTAAMVAVVVGMTLDALPDDAASLLGWLASARISLG